MDTTLEHEIKHTENYLSRLKAKDPKAVFQCPKCGEYFSNLGNYRELKMCGKCFIKYHRQKLESMTSEILGGTIESISIGEVYPLRIVDEPQITEIRIKTKEGKIVMLKTPEMLIETF